MVPAGLPFVVVYSPEAAEFRLDLPFAMVYSLCDKLLASAIVPAGLSLAMLKFIAPFRSAACEADAHRELCEFV